MRQRTPTTAGRLSCEGHTRFRDVFLSFFPSPTPSVIPVHDLRHNSSVVEFERWRTHFEAIIVIINAITVGSFLNAPRY